MVVAVLAADLPESALEEALATVADVVVMADAVIEADIRLTTTADADRQPLLHKTPIGARHCLQLVPHFAEESYRAGRMSGPVSGHAPMPRVMPGSLIHCSPGNPPKYIHDPHDPDRDRIRRNAQNCAGGEAHRSVDRRRDWWLHDGFLNAWSLWDFSSPSSVSIREESSEIRSSTSLSIPARSWPASPTSGTH